MIRQFRFESGAVREMPFDGSKGKGTAIIDVSSPSKNEIDMLSKYSGLSASYIIDSLDEDERPRVHDLEGYSKIVYRAPLPGKKITSVFSFSIIFSNKVVIILRKRKLDSFDSFIESDAEKKASIMKRGTGYFVFWLLDHITSTYLQLVEPIEAEIEKIEAEVFSSPRESTVKKLFLVKKTLIFFHRAFSSDREAITAIEKGYLKYIHRDIKVMFRDIYNDLTQLIDMEATFRDILTGSLEIYLSSVSNNLNEIMKKLSVYASFILVPTFIAAIYGMNFRFMPELFWVYGYPLALVIMIMAVFLMYLIFRRKGWI